MNLLNNLDIEYKSFGIKGERGYDTNYYYYQKIDFKNSYSNNTFWCLKQQKTRFIIIEEVNNIKLYLSDTDIIELIIGLETKMFDLLLNSFYQLYLEDGEQFIFKIGEVEYKTVGLKFSTEDKKYCFSLPIETKADISISFEDLVYLLNLIFAKEESAMDLSLEQKFHRVKRQLAKYISLSKFYKNGDQNFKSYLENIGYEVSVPDIRLVYKNDRQQNSIDNKFNNHDIFEKIFIK